jgi:hypothetical protein
MALPACASTSQRISGTQFELLANWALCRCLAKSAASEEQREDANKSAAAYLEQAAAAIETFESIDHLVDDHLQRQYSGSVTSNYNTMKCIDLFRSQELAKIAEAPPTPSSD